MTKVIDTPAFQLTLPARAENIALARHALGGLAAELGANAELVDDIKTAVSEAATNAIVHAYPSSEQGPLEVSARVVGDRRLEITVRDNGIGMQPRPIDTNGPTLRVGLALIGALADGFEIRGSEGAGTEVRISFDLDREVRDHGAYGPLKELADREQTHISVKGATSGGAAIPKVLELLAARSDLSLDRLSDSQLLGDFLAFWTSRAAVESRPLEIVIAEHEKGIEVRVGPLEPGLGEKMLAGSALPGLGTTLERFAGEVKVEPVETPAGGAEYLVLEVRE